MTIDMMKVTLSHKEMLDTIQTIHIYKQKAQQTKNIDEVVWAEATIDELLNSLHTTSECCTVTLGRQQRFAIWLALDIYLQFITKFGNQSEIDECNTLMSKFQG